jgi:3-methyladenine DNA glycosylase/8-oxoguanine DNA glycosylase
VPGAWDGFELAVRAILGQQITVAAARRALRNRRLALA